MRDEYAEALTQWARAQGALEFLADDSFTPAVWRWATRTAAADLLRDQLTAHHRGKRRPCPGCAVCRSLEERWTKLDHSAERAGERLGIDPQSRAELLVKLQAAGLLRLESEVDRAKSMLGRLMEALGVEPYVVEEDDEEDSDHPSLEVIEGGADDLP